MAKKKDITRNPPSWLEKGLFVVIILIMVGIAFPLFWDLNQPSREFYDCVEVQQVLLECMDELKNEKGDDAYTKDDLIARYQEKTGNTEIPTCPHSSGENAEELVKFRKVGKKEIVQVRCAEHEYDSTIGAIKKDDKK